MFRGHRVLHHERSAAWPLAAPFFCSIQKRRFARVLMVSLPPSTQFESMLDLCIINDDVERKSWKCVFLGSHYISVPTARARFLTASPTGSLAHIRHIPQVFAHLAFGRAGPDRLRAPTGSPPS